MNISNFLKIPAISEEFKNIDMNDKEQRCLFFNKVIEIAESPDFNLNIPLCVPSYKFRKNSWLVRNLDKIKTKVYLFVYDDDYIESGYSEFKFSDNVQIVKITQDAFAKLNLKWRGIQPKRIYIQHYMENLGITRFFMIDDDCLKSGRRVYEIGKNGSCRTKTLSVNDTLKVLQLTIEAYPEYTLLGTAHAGFLGFSKLNGVNADKLVSGCYLFNNHNVKFSDKLIHEDNQMFIDSFNSGKKQGVVDFISVAFTPINYATSTCENHEININDYIENPNYIDLKINRFGELSTHLNINKVKKHNKIYDAALYNIAVTKNIDNIKTYLKNKDKSSIDSAEW